MIGGQIRASRSREFDRSTCRDSDFEFINMVGKQAFVPDQGDSFVWTGASVKSLAQQGEVYLRLTRDLEPVVLSSTSESESSLDAPPPKQRAYDENDILATPSQMRSTSSSSALTQSTSLSSGSVSMSPVVFSNAPVTTQSAVAVSSTVVANTPSTCTPSTTHDSASTWISPDY